jgi:phytoene dehydrogenase-like protein
MKVAIIGSGVAGLAAAIRVAARGDSVTLFEKNATPGGKISQIRDNGYRFDTGPSLFTLPELVDELLSVELDSDSKTEDPDLQKASSSKNSFKYFRLENSCRYFYPDGTVFDFFQDTQKLKEQIEKNTNEDFGNILKRLNQSEFIYNLTSGLFIFNSFHQFSNFLKEENRSIP